MERGVERRGKERRGVGERREKKKEGASEQESALSLLLFLQGQESLGSGTYPYDLT